MDFTLIRSRKRKTLSATIKDTGKIEVRAPYFCPKKQVFQFLDKYKERILAKQKEVMASKPVEINIHDTPEFWYLGKTYPVKTTPHKVKTLVFVENVFFLPIAKADNYSNFFTNWYKAQSLQIIEEKLKHWAEIIRVNYSGFKITSAKRSWGTCTSRNNLCFSYRLIMCPLEVVEYVVIHELCHIIAHNHSAKFWANVRYYCPQYKAHKLWLNTNGKLLTV